MKYSTMKYFISLIMLMIAFSLIAQGTFSKGDIIVKTSPSPNEGRVVLQSIENLYDTTITITFINEYEKGDKRRSKPFFLKKGERKNWDVTFNAIKAKPVNSEESLEVYRVNVKKSSEQPAKSSEKSTANPKKEKAAGSQKAEAKKRKKSVENVDENQPVYTPANIVIEGFKAYLDSHPAFSSQKLREDSAVITRHINNLGLSSIDKVAYIKEEYLDSFVKDYLDSMAMCQSDSSRIVLEYLSRNGMVENKDSCEKIMRELFAQKIHKKGELITPLKALVEGSQPDEKEFNWKTISVYGGAVLLCLLLIIWYRKVSKSRKTKKKDVSNKEEETNLPSGADEKPALIVVGSKSAPVLKKQTLDDVYNNESYLKIEAGSFCNDSMVRALYVKNSCIKDIYNMYAEDLRNPDNPKEDGCMVIGRWVYDEKVGKYDVSLEYIVLPGDDAVFAEYELNFGGKIKLKMSEKLRKLRRDTGLQYDLTCWVHSHPGLGVFFSNSDNNVHHQLKHPSHPGFLTAFVIDILTPQQDTGIFTFRDTEVVNSKNDLIKMYSLEEMYKWALASERRSFDTNNYFDILGDVSAHNDLCYGIQLSNSAIIDMTFLTSKPTGFYGFAHGYLLKRGDKTQCVVSAVNGNERTPNTNLLGCFVVASHCSIPSIRKVIFRYLRDIHFVLVYTVSDGLLTAIPIVDNDLVNNDAYYGEKKLEDLKIWTRRRR